MLRLAASIDQGSEHPLAEAVVRAARERGLVARQARGVRVEQRHAAFAAAVEAPGRARQPGADGRAGRAHAGARRAGGAAARRGRERAVRLPSTASWSGLLAVSDPIKATSADALAALRALGIRVVMLTGDGLATARAVAARLDIDDVHGELRPADKLALVARLQARDARGRDGGRRHQRRAGARPGRRRHRHGHGDGRRDAERAA